MISPLRYPGGKAKLFPFFCQLISENRLYTMTYAEPYAGGAGLALKLLAHGFVSRVELNDIDPAIAAFWNVVLHQTDGLCALISSTPLNVDEWKRQRQIYAEGSQAGNLALGFAAYYLNRTSRSGIIEGSGPIGGYAQASKWKIDARFNKVSQIGIIAEIARHESQISITSMDALDFIEKRLDSKSHLVYLDPPYYVKGKKLYKNFYVHDDHATIARRLLASPAGKWVLSYDSVPEILALYSDLKPTVYNLQYSAGAVGSGREVIFAGGGVHLPAFPRLQIAA